MLGMLIIQSTSRPFRGSSPSLKGGPGVKEGLCLFSGFEICVQKAASPILQFLQFSVWFMERLGCRTFRCVSTFSIGPFSRFCSLEVERRQNKNFVSPDFDNKLDVLSCCGKSVVVVVTNSMHRYKALLCTWILANFSRFWISSCFKFFLIGFGIAWLRN